MASTASSDPACPTEDFARYRLIDLFKEVRRVMSQRQAIDYRLSCLLRELDQREHLDGRRLHLASWLARAFGLGYGSAREKVRTARALGHLPLIDAAFREGRLSYSKVRALTRVARAENEAELLEAAMYASADAVEHVVRRLKQRERLDDVQEMLRQRSLTYAWEEDGMLVVRARLTPEQGAVWVKAVEMAEASIASMGADDGFEARQADALTHALEASLSEGAGSGRTSDRYQVVVHVPAETLCGVSQDVPAETFRSGPGNVPAGTSGGSRKGEPATIEHGPVLHPETVRRLTCDGALVALLENDRGGVLNVGRKTRVIPWAIRRALKARDSHCQFPGCHQTRFLDGHHIVHWADGGETKLDNLVLLCRRHHRHVHEFGFPLT